MLLMGEYPRLARAARDLIQIELIGKFVNLT